MSSLPQRFYTGNEKLKGLYFIVISETDEGAKCVDNRRRNWDVVYGDDDYVFYPVDGMLYEVVAADEVYENE